MKKSKIRYDRIAICVVLLALLIFCVFGIVRIVRDRFAAEQVNGSEHTKLPRESKKEDCFTVVVDAGHGGEEDSGCVSVDNTRMEKNDVLELAFLIEDNLKKHSGVAVLMTRTDDVAVSLEERCEIANENNADLFVSVHRNSAISGNGIEAWINKTSPIPDNILATRILSALEKVGVSKNRGVSSGYREDPDSNYHVNGGTQCPSCLLELGFLTNEADNRDFDEKKKQYAAAISDAIVQTGIELGVYLPKS